MNPDPLIVNTVDEMLSDLNGAPTGDVWRTLSDGGFTRVGLSEKSGGGGTLFDAAAVLRTTGYHAAPVPVAEHGLLGGWLLEAANLPHEGHMIGFAPSLSADTLTVSHRGARGWELSGTAHRVPWGRVADRFVGLVGDSGSALVVSVDIGHASVTPGHNLAGEPRDDVTFDRCLVADADIAVAPPGVDRQAVKARGALTRALLMAGALKRVDELCRDHCANRRQFGRPLSRFQAVAQHLALIAEATAMAAMAADVATLELACGSRFDDAAVAKIVTGEAASDAARRAHQVHGAIGVTEEYELQRLTRRLWSWRDEFGGERVWSSVIGRQLIAAGSESAWAHCTSELPKSSTERRVHA